MLTKEERRRSPSSLRVGGQDLGIWKRRWWRLGWPVRWSSGELWRRWRRCEAAARFGSTVVKQGTGRGVVTEADAPRRGVAGDGLRWSQSWPERRRPALEDAGHGLPGSSGLILWTMVSRREGAEVARSHSFELLTCCWLGERVRLGYNVYECAYIYIDVYSEWTLKIHRDLIRSPNWTIK